MRRACRLWGRLTGGPKGIIYPIAPRPGWCDGSVIGGEWRGAWLSRKTVSCVTGPFRRKRKGKPARTFGGNRWLRRFMDPARAIGYPRATQKCNASNSWRIRG